MLDFSLDADQDAIGDVFGRFFRSESPPSVVRASEPLGFAADLWERLGALDAHDIRIPSNSAPGASMSDLVVIAEALGAAIAPVPLIEHWAASALLTASAGGHASGHGDIASMALSPAIDGVWRLVPAGAVAHTVVGVDGDEIVAVTSEPPMTAPGNHASAPLADRSIAEGERRVLGDRRLFAHSLDEWRLLTASALTGIADAAMRLGVDYVLERRQFGRPVGSYQAIQHGLADFPAAIDGARFLVHKAARSLDDGLVGGAGEVNVELGQVTEFSALASMAFIAAADAAAMCTDRSLHYHGGYGFAEEYDIQLYYRRARGWANAMGSLAAERRRLADLLLPGGAR